MNQYWLIFILGHISFNLVAAPDWSRGVKIPLGQTRENIYQLDPFELEESKTKGFAHAAYWPIPITGLYIPYRPFEDFLEGDETNPLKKFVNNLIKRKMGYSSLEQFFNWLGLNDFPEIDGPGDFVENPYTGPDQVPMGATLRDFNKSLGMTFSCATCHTGRFLGHTVVGLTNKRPRANDFFELAKKNVPLIPSFLFSLATGATKEEVAMFKRSKRNINAIGGVRPQVLGLDTSLPHVALSLKRRAKDPYASKSRYYEKKPRASALDHKVADSKPMPWWNLKYKTRWLSDGSIVAGNPILTNFLWNEIGRGTDLKELEQWMKNNDEQIKELTIAAFANKAPHWTDFFPASSIDLPSAKRGEKVYNRSCRKCHGDHQKGWSAANKDDLSLVDQLKTIRVIYHKMTPVKDVGTDPNRYEAVKYFFEDLNNLQISKWMKTIIVPQKGYVPPPLEGIFLRYPYFHNNSIPNLCALMQKESERPTQFYQGPSEKREDFDDDCVGYPIGDKTPSSWRQEKHALFDTRKDGLSSKGHWEPFYDADGNPKMTKEQKYDLRMYLKTL